MAQTSNLAQPGGDLRALSEMDMLIDDECMDIDNLSLHLSNLSRGDHLSEKMKLKEDET